MVAYLRPEGMRHARYIREDQIEQISLYMGWFPHKLLQAVGITVFMQGFSLKAIASRESKPRFAVDVQVTENYRSHCVSP